MLNEDLAMGAWLVWRKLKRHTSEPIPVSLPPMRDMVIAPDLAERQAAYHRTASALHAIDAAYYQTIADMTQLVEQEGWD